MYFGVFLYPVSSSAGNQSYPPEAVLMHAVISGERNTKC